ncbi:hypothetical protein N7474_009676 [Penicillium riverlandense]|uniref:uncharacterized protein n=1 Tax=Penicillium riverlandense TaxID=1903569 RepID=UPI0025497AE1|nr:uncharacterized protein N7474_009676 [Penicillium riverlandense]KAJ5808407.1 hypothetical protein N7474_009676 [Penicillium riverlandense]
MAPHTIMIQINCYRDRKRQFEIYRKRGANEGKAQTRDKAESSNELSTATHPVIALHVAVKEPKKRIPAVTH